MWSGAYSDLREQGINLPVGAPVDPSKLEGVARYDVSGVNVSLWSAPEVGGGACWLWVLVAQDARPRQTGSCDEATQTGAAVGTRQWIFSTALPGILIVDVRVQDVDSVLLQFPDGSTQPMAMFGGHALAVVSLSSAPPTTVVARDASDSVIQVAPLFPPRFLRTGVLDVCSSICIGNADGGSEITWG
jgi:hypothetical protein